MSGNKVAFSLYRAIRREGRVLSSLLQKNGRALAQERDILKEYVDLQHLLPCIQHAFTMSQLRRQHPWTSKDDDDDMLSLVIRNLFEASRDAPSDVYTHTHTNLLHFTSVHLNISISIAITVSITIPSHYLHPIPSIAIIANIDTELSPFLSPSPSPSPF